MKYDIMAQLPTAVFYFRLGNSDANPGFHFLRMMCLMLQNRQPLLGTEPATSSTRSCNKLRYRFDLTKIPLNIFQYNLFTSFDYLRTSHFSNLFNFLIRISVRPDCCLVFSQLDFWRIYRILSTFAPCLDVNVVSLILMWCYSY